MRTTDPYVKGYPAIIPALSILAILPAIFYVLLSKIHENLSVRLGLKLMQCNLQDSSDFPLLIPESDRAFYLGFTCLTELAVQSFEQSDEHSSSKVCMVQFLGRDLIFIMIF